MEDITKEEYETTQQQMLLIARIVREMPLAAFLRAAERMDTVAPIIDPTLYLRGRDKLDTIKKMAEGLLAFQNSLPLVCPQCKVNEVPKGLVYCGAACSQMREAKAHVVTSTDIMKCPALNLSASHYNMDGSCKCPKPDEPSSSFSSSARST